MPLDLEVFRIKIRSIIFSIFSLFVFALSVINFSGLGAYLVWAGGAAILGFAFEAVWQSRYLGKKWSSAVLAFLYLVGYFGVLAGISGNVSRFLIAIAGTGLYLWHQVRYVKNRPAFLEEIFALAATFLVLVSIWEINFFFRPPWWAILAVSFGISFLFFWEMFDRHRKTALERQVYSLSAALIIVEVSWGVLYLPVHQYVHKQGNRPGMERRVLFERRGWS